MGSRLRAPGGKPETPQEMEDEDIEAVVDMNPSQDVVDSGIGGFLIQRHVNTAPFSDKVGPIREVRVSRESDEVNENVCLTPHHAVVWVDANHAFINTGAARVNAVSFTQTDPCSLAVLVGNASVQIYSSTQFRAELKLASTPVVKCMQWVRHLDNVLAVVLLDRVNLYQIPPLTESSSPVSIDAESALLWSSSGGFGENNYFPSSVDARVAVSGTHIELIVGNNSNNFVHYFSLSREFQLLNSRVFGYNDPGRRVTEDSSTESSATGVCVAFLTTEPHRFVAGYSNGSIGLFDLRDATGPVDVVVTLAGIRRWLVELVPSSVDPSVVFGAFQAGAVVNLNASEGDVQVQPIGGEVKLAQCWGIDSISDRVFAAMSSGVVLTLDLSLRDKLRRGMTGYVSRWSRPASPAPVTVTDDLVEIITKEIDPATPFSVTVFDPKQVPRNLKLLKASDGASNEPPPLGVGLDAIAVTCLRAHPAGLVATGLEGGIVHLFRYLQ